jgi:hypothetical protein
MSLGSPLTVAPYQPNVVAARFQRSIVPRETGGSIRIPIVIIEDTDTCRY